MHDPKGFSRRWALSCFAPCDTKSNKERKKVRATYSDSKSLQKRFPSNLFRAENEKRKVVHQNSLWDNEKTRRSSVMKQEFGTICSWSWSAHRCCRTGFFSSCHDWQRELFCRQTHLSLRSLSRANAKYFFHIRDTKAQKKYELTLRGQCQSFGKYYPNTRVLICVGLEPSWYSIVYKERFPGSGKTNLARCFH